MPFKNLPDAANKIWEDVYNSSKSKGDSEEIAARKAWAAVSRGFKKVGDTWVKKSDVLSEFSMAITASPLDKSTGEMRWKAVASDTERDSYNESMSLELYRSFLKNIEEKLPPPAPFGDFVTSKFWKGGMPYISVSHYSDLDGEAVPGEITDLYMDGKCLKAKGRFFDTELGRACWRSLNKDFADNVPDEKRIRISIAFLDLTHAHGDGTVFERRSLLDRCSKCGTGHGDKTYKNGYLVHLAMTRVPVNPRAEMEVERSMKKITRKEDAASIVGEENAEVLDAQAELVGRSEVMVEKNDTEEVPAVDVAPAGDPPVTEPVVETPAVVEAPVETATVAEPVLPVTDDPNPPEPDECPIDTEVKALSAAVVEIMKDQSTTKEAKMNAIRPTIDALGLAIDRAFTVQSSEATPEVPASMTLDVVKKIVAEQNQPILDALANLQASMQSVTAQKSQVNPVIPKPRSPDPTILRSIVQKQMGESKPDSIINICRRSVGITDPQ